MTNHNNTMTDITEEEVIQKLETEKNEYVKGRYGILELNEKITKLEQLIDELKESQRTVQDVLNEEIVNRLREKLAKLKSIPKNGDSFLFTHYKIETVDLEAILGEKND